MADDIQTDLIVRAIAEGFDKLASDMGTKVGGAANKAEKEVSKLDRAKKALNQTMKQMTMALGGARIALAFVEQGFAFAAAQAEKLGRVDVKTNIDDAKNALSGLADVLVQIPIGGRDFLQWVGDGALGIANFARTVGALGVQMQLSLGIIDQQTAIQQINNLVTDEAAEAKKELADSEKEADEWTKRLKDSMQQIEGFEASEKAARNAEKSLADLRAELRELRREHGEAAFSAQELEDMQLDLASAQLDVKVSSRDLWVAEQDLRDAQAGLTGGLEEAEVAYERARISNEKAHNRLEELTKAYDEAQKATIDNSAAISEMTDRLNEQKDRLYEAQRAALAYARAMGDVNEQVRISADLGVPSGIINPGQPGHRQHGGAFSAGGAYFINESPSTRPEVVMVNPGGGGQVMTSQQINNRTMNVGPVSIGGGMDAAELQAMLRQALYGG